MTLNEVFVGILTLAVVVLVIFLVALIRRASDTMKTLDSVAADLRQNLTSLKLVTDNLGTATEDFKVLSGSVREVGESVKQVSGSVKQVAAMVQEVSTSTSVTMSGVRAGLRAGFEVLLKGLMK